MYGCESWTIKKAECWRIDAFELWCWRRLLRVPWTARRSNQSFLKKISPEYSLEGLMLKLKFQNFGHLMWRTDLLEKTLMLGKIEGRRRKGWQRMRWLDGITDLIIFNSIMYLVLSTKGTNRFGNDTTQMEGTETQKQRVYRPLVSGYKFGQALGVGDGQGSLACCSPWCHKQSDTTEQLNWTESHRQRDLSEKSFRMFYNSCTIFTVSSTHYLEATFKWNFSHLKNFQSF